MVHVTCWNAWVTFSLWNMLLSLMSTTLAIGASKRAIERVTFTLHSSSGRMPENGQKSTRHGGQIEGEPSGNAAIASIAKQLEAKP